jgi:hypothetical protein
MKAMVAIGSPPPRIETGAPLRGDRRNHYVISSIRDGSCRRTEYDTLRDLPRGYHAPERDEELAGERHDHLLTQARSAVDARVGNKLMRVFFNLCAVCFHDEEVNCKLFSALASPV